MSRRVVIDIAQQSLSVTVTSGNGDVLDSMLLEGPPAALEDEVHEVIREAFRSVAGDGER